MLSFPLSLPFVFFKSTSKKKADENTDKNEFKFKFKEADNDFLDISLTSKALKDKNLKTHSYQRDVDDEVDISVSEMIEFQKKASSNSLRKDRRDSSSLDKKLNEIRTGTYNKDLDTILLHQTTYDDQVLDPIDEMKYDPKLSRKIKVDKRRAKHMLFSKA